MRACSAGPIPSPLSCTASCTVRAPGPALASSEIAPSRVNFTALPSRLFSTWRTRDASPITQCGRGRVDCSEKARPLSAARSLNTSATCTSSAFRSKGLLDSENWPALMRDTSSRSLISSSRWMPELSTSSRRSVWVGSRDSRCSSRVRPSMPCKGVRNSWLTLARKRVRSALCSRASCKAASFSRTSCALCKLNCMALLSWREVARAVNSINAARISCPALAK